MPIIETQFKLKEDFETLKQEYLENEKRIKELEADESTYMKETDVRFAYIVFRSMDAIEPLKRAYNYSACKVCCIMSCGCCCQEKYKEIKRKHFFKKWPNV